MADARLLAVYADAGAAARALAALRERGQTRFESFAPVPDPLLQARLSAPPSPVRLFTLAGGVLGTACGLALCIWTSLSWPLPTGGKPVVAIPAFLVIAFEVAILFGALATLLGFFVNARLPRSSKPAAYDPRFTEDRYGVLVTTSAEESAGVRDLLSAAGAEEGRGA